jgi:hypothetical protein
MNELVERRSSDHPSILCMRRADDEPGWRFPSASRHVVSDQVGSSRCVAAVEIRARVDWTRGQFVFPGAQLRAFSGKDLPFMTFIARTKTFAVLKQ